MSNLQPGLWPAGPEQVAGVHALCSRYPPAFSARAICRLVDAAALHSASAGMLSALRSQALLNNGPS